MPAPYHSTHMKQQTTNGGRPRSSKAAGARNGAGGWSTRRSIAPRPSCSTASPRCAAARPGLGEYCYGLQGTPTHWALAEALTELEPGAAGTALYSSGPGGDHRALLAVLKPGDELLVTDNVYGPTRRFCDDLPRALRGRDALLRPADRRRRSPRLFGEATRAILLESPGSLTMEVQDVPGICARRPRARHRRPCSTIPGRRPCSSPPSPPASTSASSPRPNMSAATPTSCSARRPRPRALSRRSQRTSWDLGHAVSPDDAWLGSRGLRTMAVRLRQHEESALEDRATGSRRSRRSAGCFTRPCPIAPATNFGSATSRARRACSRSSSRAPAKPNARRSSTARDVRDRLQLGRLSKASPSRSSRPHGVVAPRAEPRPPANRARERRRPHRRPRPGVRRCFA